MSDSQKQTYADHHHQVTKLSSAAAKRPLSQQEHEKLHRELAMDDRECPKLGELEKLLEECRENGAKVIIFSEWERML